MAKTEKTAFFRHLESKVESSFQPSASVEAGVVDGSFLLRVLTKFFRIYPQATYGRLAVTMSIIAMSIGSKMCQALPAYHAFTGTDYTSAIIRIISVLF